MISRIRQGTASPRWYCAFGDVSCHALRWKMMMMMMQGGRESRALEHNS